MYVVSSFDKFIIQCHNMYLVVWRTQCLSGSKMLSRRGNCDSRNAAGVPTKKILFARLQILDHQLGANRVNNVLSIWVRYKTA